MKQKSHLNTRNHWFQKGELDGYVNKRRTLPDSMTDWDLEMYEKGVIAGRQQRVENEAPSCGHPNHLLPSGRGAI